MYAYGRNPDQNKDFNFIPLYLNKICQINISKMDFETV